MTSKNKKDTKSKTDKSSAIDGEARIGGIHDRAELKSFLASIRDRMTEEVVPPIFAVSAMNYVLNLPNVYEVFDNENKEIARDIWLRLKQIGLQLRNPVLLFGLEAEDANSAA